MVVPLAAVAAGHETSTEVGVEVVTVGTVPDGQLGEGAGVHAAAIETTSKAIEGAMTRRTRFVGPDVRSVPVVDSMTLTYIV